MIIMEHVADEPRKRITARVSENVRAVRDRSGTIVGYEGTVENISQQKEAEEQLQQSLDRLRTLSGRLEVVREEERARIAREVHDELGVSLTCLKIDLSRVNAIVGEGEGAKHARGFWGRYQLSHNAGNQRHRPDESSHAYNGRFPPGELFDRPGGNGHVHGHETV